MGQGSADVSYQWEECGIYTITVSATNDGDVVTDTHVISIGPPKPIDSVTITGPTMGTINTKYTFTATVSPLDATKPILYTWSPTPATGQGSSVVTYIWPATGGRTITVTAMNGGSSVTDSHTITIGIIPIQSVAIDGDPMGFAGYPYAFSAVISPLDASLPITYTWSPSPTEGQGSPDVIYNWETAGIKVFSVTAVNVMGFVTAFHIITIVPEPVPVCCVTITGPTTGTVNFDYAFTAIASPITATPPIHYNWSPEPVTGQGFPNVTYRWTELGTKVISATARNYYAAGSNTRTIIVEVVPLERVTIGGPATGLINKVYTFTATVSPVTTTQPITYVWQATGQSDVVTTTNAPSQAVTFTWNMTGTKFISVMVTNVGSIVTDVQPIIVSSPPLTGIYLPVVLSCWPSTPITPTLKEIINGDGHGNYTVRWIRRSSACITESYMLEEAASSDFSDTQPIYTGTATFRDITERGATRYFYRVKAFNNWGNSDWSNTQWVDVLYEKEVNDSDSMANGPLVSGNTYYGKGDHDKDFDFFKIYLHKGERITVSLISHPGQEGVQLLLYYPSYPHLKAWDPYPPDYYIDYAATEDGWYFICVYTATGHPSDTYYILRVMAFP